MKSIAIWLSCNLERKVSKVGLLSNELTEGSKSRNKKITTFT